MRNSLRLGILAGMILLITNILFGAYLQFEPMELLQPDGTRLELFASGDEYYNWLHDKDGYTIKQNDKGWYVYLNIDAKEELIFTDLIVGRDLPSQGNLTPWTNIPAQKIGKIRERASRQLTEIGNGRTPTTGIINNLAVFIRFSDQAEFGQNISSYNSMFNGTTGNTMQSYFWEASYNSLNIPTTFYPTPTTMVVSWQDTSHLRSYFSPYSATNTGGYVDDADRTAREHTLLVNAINGVSSQIPASLNIDADNDNNVDNVCFIIQGATDPWATLLWPHRWSLFSQNVSINGKRVYDYNFQISAHLTSSGNGVLCHEMFHSLGAPDLYHYTSDGNTPVGTWDIMQSNTNPPQHMSAFMKYKYGHWITSLPTLMTTGTYTLNPVGTSTDCVYKINSPNTTTQYFVAEFRKKTGTFENSIPGSGIIIYRINTTCGNGNADGPPDEVYAYRLNGTTTANGTINSANFSTETGRTSFNSGTNPSCFLVDGSNGGISISSISSSAGSTMSFNYTLNNPPQNLAATSGNSAVVLTWQSTVIGTPSGYKIYRNNSYLTTASNLTYTDSNVTVGTSYTYHVTATFSNPTSETGISNTVSIVVSDISVVAIGSGTTTGQGIPIEPYYGYTYSQSIYLQSEINTASKSINKIAWNYNGNSAWTDGIKIYMGHTSLSSFAGTSSWVPLAEMSLVYDGNISAPASAGWIELNLDTPFSYNNTQNLVIAVDENTSGFHNNSDEFYSVSVTGNRSLVYFSDSINPDPVSPPTSGVVLNTRTYVPNVRLTFATYPVFAVTPSAIDFGTIMNSTFSTQTIRVTNSGNGVMTVSSISLNNAQFYVSGLPVMPKAVSEGQYFEFQINYQPINAGSNSAVLTIVDNLTRLSRTINVSGSCYVATITAFPWTENYNTWSPVNWTLTGATRSWVQYTDLTTGNNSSRANLGAWSAPNNAVMITPPLHPTLTSKLSFKWSHLYSSTFPNDTLKVYYSTNRTNWSLLWAIGNTGFNSNDGATNTNPGSFAIQDIALPEGHNSQNFFIKFEAVSGFGSDVFVDDVSVLSLQAIAITPTLMPFGAVAVGTAPSQVVTIQNTGELTLTGSIVTPSVYSVSNSARDSEMRNTLSFSIPGGQSRTYNIIMTPVAALTYNGFVYVYSNDPVQPTKMIRVTGSGFLPARITLNTNSFTTSALYGSTTTQTLQISNTGNQTLNYSIQLSEPARNTLSRSSIDRNLNWIGLSATSGSINTGQNQTITLTYASQITTPGVHQAILSITSNDPVTPTKIVDVSFDVTMIKPVAVISKSSSGILLSWNVTPGANAYRIYRSETRDGDYLLVGTVSQTTFADTGTINRAFYKVKAVFE